VTTKDRLTHLVSLLLLILLVFGKSLNFSFVTDDLPNIFDTAKRFAMSDFVKIFSTPQVIHQNYYRPLDTFYFIFTSNLFGSNYFFYHLLNLIFHITAVFMFYNFLNSIRKDDDFYNLFFAAIFAVHPVNVEPVCWISARNQIIIAILLLLLIKNVQAYTEGRKKLFFSIPILVISGLFFHEIFIVSIFWVFAYLTLLKKNVGKRSFVEISLAVFVTLFLYIMLRYMFLNKFAGDAYPFVERFYSMFLLIKEYLKIMFNPFALRVHYYDLKAVSQINLSVLLAMIEVLIFIVAIVLNRKNKIMLFGGGLFFLSLLPSSGIITFVHKSLISDRYLYIPLMAFLIFISELIKPLYRRFKKLSLIVLSAVIIFFAIFSNVRSNIWENELANVLQRIREFPNSPIERINLACVYVLDGRLDEAEKELLLSIKLSQKPSALSYLNLSYIYRLKGDIAGAAKQLEKYLEFDDKSVPVLYSLGVIKQEKGDIVGAKKLYEKAYLLSLEGSEERANILNNLGVIYLQEGDLEKARRCFEEAYEILPYQENIRRNYEMVKNLTR